ncbi:endolytic transglycosylase MltG [Arenibacter certesii]|uniref:Endolytic murein transglycosylase n=1 Tax=Arenibacter certesii TaxID=228955 RepID=A0A918J1G4_9FLAO|nr:endolytic transglycosylase MltG [Arenibacter certesii]GGW42966.1 aminodeoxychorismate lyase [Arenibacter certesii]
MNLKRTLLIVVGLGLVLGAIITYMVYGTFFTPNTKFQDETSYVYIPTDANFETVKDIMEPALEDMEKFVSAANRKGYSDNVKPGKFALKKGMNNNEIINSLRSRNIPVKLAFNNQETLADLAGRVSLQIEADSLSLLKSFQDNAFLEANGFNEDTALSMYIPNSYEFFWNTTAKGFRERMLKEYQRFWNKNRLTKAKDRGLTPSEVINLASIVHKETAKVEERPKVAGVYLNRLKTGMLLQADPTVIYAIKKHTGNFDTIIKRVLYRDLELNSPYNTYRTSGLPPGPIAMPDISAIDAVLAPEKHDYYYFVANVENFGYHKFAKTLAQHNRNKVQYIRWINSQKINR